MTRVRKLLDHSRLHYQVSYQLRSASMTWLSFRLPRLYLQLSDLLPISVRSPVAQLDALQRCVSDARIIESCHFTRRPSFRAITLQSKEETDIPIRRTTGTSTDTMSKGIAEYEQITPKSGCMRWSQGCDGRPTIHRSDFHLRYQLNGQACWSGRPSAYGAWGVWGSRKPIPSKFRSKEAWKHQ